MKTFSSLALPLATIVSTYICSCSAWGQVPPVITTQPASKAVSLGASVSLSVAASGTGPMSFQWRMNQGDLLLATNSVLSLTNVQFAQAGDYQAVIANAQGSVTSVIARLVVGPAFLKVTAGVVAGTSGGTGGAWADCNNDGWLDLFVAFGNGSTSMLF